MPIDAFQHINVRAADVEASRNFYERILGLRAGDRPPFASVGYWLYRGSEAIVHLVQRAHDEAAPAGPGALDHVAFQARDLDGMKRLLHDAAVPFREAVVPRDGSVQLFIHDPDGVKIELNFVPARDPLSGA
jgi:catechol 2,3-dioxygenase-like lactoylglutathione lyase family enzyme